MFLPSVEKGHDPNHERQVQPIVADPDLEKQRKRWARMSAELAGRL